MLAAVDKRLSPAEQQECEGPEGDGTISLDEASAALASLPRGKAPGSDGLTYEFYAAFWEEVGQLLVDAFNSVFTSQQQQPQLSQRRRLGLITLIYKGGGKPKDSASMAHHLAQCRCEDSGQGPNLEVWGCPRFSYRQYTDSICAGPRHSRQCLMPS